MSDFNPSEEFIGLLRSINLAIGFIGLLVASLVLAVPRWGRWTVATRLGWMSMFLFVFVATYSTFEVKFLDTVLRVPMVTVALLWAITASLWPLYESWSSRKTRK